MSIEKLITRNSNNKLKAVLLGSALTLSGFALSACATENDGLGGTSQEDIAQKESTNSGITYSYLKDGSRITSYGQDGLSNVLAHCDGKDMVERVDHFDNGYDGSGNGIERSVNHPACADGMLTPEDFKIPG
jgi:hypothetical protein